MTRKHSFALLILLLLSSSDLKALPFEDPESFKKKFFVAHSKGYAALDSLHGEIVKSGLKLKDGNEGISAFYHYAREDCNRKKSCKAYFSAWRLERPASIVPHVVAMFEMKEEAWKSRGTGYANKVSRKNMLRFTDLAQRGLEEFSQMSVKGVDPTALLRKYEFEIHSGKRDEAEKTYRFLIEEFPWYFPIYSKKAYFLQPKWGGSYPALSQFALEAADTTNELFGDAIYAIIAKDTMGRCSRREFGFYYFDWERVKRGFSDYNRFFPLDNYTVASQGLMASYVSDRETARAVLAKLESDDFKQIRKDLWNGELNFRDFAKWARSAPSIREELTRSAFNSLETGKLDVFKSAVDKIGPDVRDVDGRSLMHRSIEKGRSDFVQYLFDKGYKRPKNDYSLFNHAVSNGDLDMIRTLLKNKQDPNENMYRGNKVIHYVVKKKHHKILNELLKDKDLEINKLGASECAPICIAIQEQDELAFNLILNSPRLRFDTPVNRERETSLEFASRRNDMAFVKAISKRLSEMEYDSVIAGIIDRASGIAKAEENSDVQIFLDELKLEKERLAHLDRMKKHEVATKQVGLVRRKGDQLGEEMKIFFDQVQAASKDNDHKALLSNFSPDGLSQFADALGVSDSELQDRELAKGKYPKILKFGVVSGHSMANGVTYIKLRLPGVDTRYKIRVIKEGGKLLFDEWPKS